MYFHRGRFIFFRILARGIFGHRFAPSEGKRREKTEEDEAGHDNRRKKRKTRHNGEADTEDHQVYDEHTCHEFARILAQNPSVDSSGKRAQKRKARAEGEEKVGERRVETGSHVEVISVQEFDELPFSFVCGFERYEQTDTVKKSV